MLDLSGEVRLLRELSDRFRPEEMADALRAFLRREGASDVGGAGEEVTFTVPLGHALLRHGLGPADAGAIRFRGDARGVVMAYRVRVRRLAMLGTGLAGVAGLVGSAFTPTAGLAAFAMTGFLCVMNSWLGAHMRYPAVFFRALNEAVKMPPPPPPVSRFHRRPRRLRGPP